MVKILKHPVIQHKVTELRKVETTSSLFRQITNEIASLMVYEVTHDLPLREIEINTPITVTKQMTLANKKMVLVPILRAGLGMVDGMLSVIPTAKIGHIGIYRNEETMEPVEYFVKLPDELDKRMVVVIDPMLATGGSASYAIDVLKSKGAINIKLVCIVAAPEGVKLIEKNHPDVEIVLATMDENLNEAGYIVPGLGDAGDRIFGTT